MIHYKKRADVITYSEMISCKARKAKEVICAACGRKFVIRLHDQKGGNSNKYCYEPRCEERRESERKRRARKNRQAKLAIKRTL